MSKMIQLRDGPEAFREIETPALVLDRRILERNLARMGHHLRRLGVALRPHAKTAKSIDVLRLALAGQPGGITVSTLREAEYFFGQGVQDILYAVGIAPVKMAHAAALIRRGCRLSLILDSPEAISILQQASAREQVQFPVLIELDVDGHRAGVQPDSAALLELARAISGGSGVELRGVMTHAGDSYQCRSQSQLRAMAERERAGAVLAATRLRTAGHAAPVVSVGSTPTATFATDLSGVTEVRVGVYMFNDLVMAGLGVCAIADIALSVLVSVIGHQAERGWIITDGGWMALSRDRGTSSQPVDQGYGIVLDVEGSVSPDDLVVVSTNQEHGIVARRDGKPLPLTRYPVGSSLRILPNHACATAAQHSCYHVIDSDRFESVATWRRVNGW
jgi:D-serine deaminase-like pyridoxal phosphate-dependent protein